MIPELSEPQRFESPNASQSSNRFPRRWWIQRSIWLGQILLALAFVVLASRQVNLIQLTRTVADARWEWLGVALIVSFATRILHAWEWQLLLTKVGRAPLLGLVGVILIGTLVNAVLPGSLGDVAKIQIAANRYGLPRAGLIGGRGAEALVNNIMFAIFVVLSIALVGGASGSPVLLGVLAAASIAVTFAAMIASRTLPPLMPGWPLLQRLPARLRGSLEHHWPGFHDGFEGIRRPKLLAGLLFLNLFGWTVDIAVNWAYGNAFGLEVSFAAYVSVTVVLALITSVPVTFGNVGAWEFGVLGVLALYNVPADQALAFAVGSHLFITVFNIALGLLAAALMRVKLSDILHVRRQQRSDVALQPLSEPT